MKNRHHLMIPRLFWISLVAIVLSVNLLAWRTMNHLLPLPETLSLADTIARKAQVLDRDATPLIITYQNEWNLHDTVELHKIPEILQKIFILSEDKRFFEHHGVDWLARLHATWQNFKTLRGVRGAGTVSEQVIRLLHPRARTVWSHWLEGIEAAQLEKRFSKVDILEFYLNQVPYARQRRGVVQAARHYFNRDLDTLNLKEMLALVVLVRAPGRLDLQRSTTIIERPIMRLAKRLLELEVITPDDYNTLFVSPIRLQPIDLPIQANHFVNYIYASEPPDHLQQQGRLQTTLDAGLQHVVQAILDNRLRDLSNKNVNQGAVLVIDHLHDNEVLAWVTGTIDELVQPILRQLQGTGIDAVTTPRQPGSTLKPFLYALALEKGWTTATLINDAPLAESVGTGMHNYRNYSRSYYGTLRLRDALGNSLNTPAVRTIQFVGADLFLQRLRQLGMSSLTADSDFYGDGLALGNGGVTLLELVQAYATLANQGQWHPVRVLRNAPTVQPITIFTPQASSLVADILSDPDARRLEFGRGALLRFPIQTAVKTGTSTDYRDAWALGFNYRYTVGVWLGNLDQQPMSHVSGSTGPALVLRAVFAELNRREETQPLQLNSQLVQVEICRTTGKRATPDCPSRAEWFIRGTEPNLESSSVNPENDANDNLLRLRQPSEGLQLAMDPRIPDEDEAFALKLPHELPIALVEWLVDGEVIGTTPANIHQYLWQMQRGTHIAQARVWQTPTHQPVETPEVKFYVK